MATEIERKFLVNISEVERVIKEQGLTPLNIVQGYLDCRGATVRVRIEDDKGYLVIKGPKTGISCPEFDYEIPKEDAYKIFKLTYGLAIIKKRYKIIYRGHEWEVDFFEGPNTGLVVAEIELDIEDEYFRNPPWLGKEVTDDARYSNYNLSIKPYMFWK